MREREWVEYVAENLGGRLKSRNLRVETGMRLAYGYEIAAYTELPNAKLKEYQTDLAIVEDLEDGSWLPRVIVEAKVESITTHDAITYSRKAESHKTVHPYLRYGVMLGHRGGSPLPGRLYRHGSGFDFMISFRDFSLSEDEWSSLIKIIKDEVRASRNLEKIIYDSQLRDRDRYTVFRRQFILQ